MNKFLFLVLLFLSFTAEAQVPGFKGKKWIVNYNLHTFSRVLYSSNEGFLDYIKPHFRHNIEVGKVKSRTFILAGFMEYISVPHDFFIKDSYERLPVRGLSAGAAFYFFNYQGKGAIAPLGNYGKLSVGLTYYQVLNKNNVYPAEEKVLEENLAPIVMYSIGKKNMIFESLLTDFGIQFGLLLPSLKKPEYHDLHNSARQNLWSYYVFNFYLALGMPL